jgi:hypothetical protein
LTTRLWGRLAVAALGLLGIVPGETQPVVLIMPPPAAAGTYRVGATLVQDGVAWFHDRGMPIAIGRQTVTLDGGIRIGE